jgi:transcriptional regulator with XRE-family HTH domain
MSQSALAREIWGEQEDSRGYKVARNRDRISSYEAGKSVPEPHNLQKLADVLGMSVEELAPDLVADAVDSAEPEVSINMVPGGEGYVHLKVNTLTDMETAMKVGALLAKNPLTKSIMANPGQ